MGLLTGGIAKMVAGATSSVTYAITLTRKTSTPGETDWDNGVSVPKTYSCKGFISDYTAFQAAAKSILLGDKKLLIIAGTLSMTPAPDDTVTVKGETYQVIQVEGDPADATFVLQVRK